MEKINEICELYLDPRIICSGQPVIPAGSFEDLSLHLSKLEDVDFSYEDVLTILEELTKKFSACGGNSGGRLAVLRRYKDSGFNYIAEKLKKT
jgi:hypothetical protein